MPENGKTIRGLGIAITIFAGLSIVLALGLTALAGMFAVGLADDDYARYSNSGRFSSISIDDLDLSPSDIRELRELGIDVDDFEIDIDDAYAFAGLIAILLALGAFGTLVAGALSLVAGILGITRCRRPDKMQAVFVWAIIGAVFCFFVGRIVSLVLLIILAVEAHKYRRDYTYIPLDGEPAQGWNA